MPGAMVALLREDGQVLLTKRRDSGLWCLPAGAAEADLHTIHYPNGDLTHCFAMCFLARRWSGEPRAGLDEATEVQFTHLDQLPDSLDPPAGHALALLEEYLDDGIFQVR